MQLRRHTEAGDTIIIDNAHGGQTFAEASLFSSSYHCEAVACETSELVAMNKVRILKAMRQNSLFAFALSARFATEIQAQRRRLQLVSIKSAPQRVFAAIADRLADGQHNNICSRNRPHPRGHLPGPDTTHQAGLLLVKTGRGRYEMSKIRTRTGG